MSSLCLIVLQVTRMLFGSDAPATRLLSSMFSGILAGQIHQHQKQQCCATAATATGSYPLVLPTMSTAVVG
jgi:hypothetical protein